MSMNKPREHSFISKQQSSFYSRKQNLPNKDEKGKAKKDDDSDEMADADSYTESGGEIQKLDSFESGSDSSDCEIVNPNERAKGAGFF